jgi:hypothetical protein
MKMVTFLLTGYGREGTLAGTINHQSHRSSFNCSIKRKYPLLVKEAIYNVIRGSGRCPDISAVNSSVTWLCPKDSRWIVKAWFLVVVIVIICFVLRWVSWCQGSWFLFRIRIPLRRVSDQESRNTKNRTGLSIGNGPRLLVAPKLPHEEISWKVFKLTWSDQRSGLTK